MSIYSLHINSQASITFFPPSFYRLSLLYFPQSSRAWIPRRRFIYRLSVVLPGSMATHWFCGHCNYGPMMIETIEHCVICHRQRDSYARYEDLGASFTASLNQPDPLSSATHRSHRGLISYQPTSELGVEELPVQGTTSVPTKWSCRQGKWSSTCIYMSCFYRTNGRQRQRYSF